MYKENTTFAQLMQLSNRLDFETYVISDATPVSDPQGADRGSYRTLRGGDYSSATNQCERNYRKDGYVPATAGGWNVGLRVVCRP